MQGREDGSMLYKEKSTAISEVLGMWGGRAPSMDVSQKDSAPKTGKSTAEEVEVCGVKGEESCCKEL